MSGQEPQTLSYLEHMELCYLYSLVELLPRYVLSPKIWYLLIQIYN